jgi:hypothetical protein
MQVGRISGITPVNGVSKSCRLCRHFINNHCSSLNIKVVAVSRATSCKEYNNKKKK